MITSEKQLRKRRVQKTDDAEARQLVERINALRERKREDQKMREKAEQRRQELQAEYDTLRAELGEEVAS